MPKKKITALSVFINEIIRPEKYSLLGRNYKTQDLVAEAYERFKELSDVEKTYYVNKAKGDNLNKNDRNEIQSIKKPESREQMVTVEWKKAINVYLDMYETTEELKKHRFHIVGVQHALKTDEGEYIPLEIGVIQWCMEGGIDNFYHTFLDPDKIPLGYSYQVQSHAEKTHQIEEDRFKDFSSNYDTLWQQFYSFICLQGTPNPVYCMKKNIAQVRGCLEWLSMKAWSGRQVKVYPIEELVIQLFSVVGVSSFPLSITSFLTSVRFEHLKHTRCSEHNNLASQHCAIGHAKMISYLISDALSEMYSFEITKKHIPEEDSSTYKVCQRKSQKGIVHPSTNDDEDDEEEKDEDSNIDPDEDKDADDSFMNVNDFKLEFNKDSQNSDNGSSNSNQNNSYRGNNMNHKSAKRFHDSSNHAFGNNRWKHTGWDDRERENSSTSSSYTSRGLESGGGGWGQYKEKDHLGRSRENSERFRRPVEPFGKAIPKAKTNLRASEILLTDKMNVTETREGVFSHSRYSDHNNYTEQHIQPPYNAFNQRHSQNFGMRQNMNGNNLYQQSYNINYADASRNPNVNRNNNFNNFYNN